MPQKNEKVAELSIKPTLYQIQQLLNSFEIDMSNDISKVQQIHIIEKPSNERIAQVINIMKENQQRHRDTIERINKATIDYLDKRKKKFDTLTSQVLKQLGQKDKVRISENLKQKNKQQEEKIIGNQQCDRAYKKNELKQQDVELELPQRNQNTSAIFNAQVELELPQRNQNTSAIFNAQVELELPQRNQNTSAIFNAYRGYDAELKLPQRNIFNFQRQKDQKLIHNTLPFYPINLRYSSYNALCTVGFQIFDQVSIVGKMKNNRLPQEFLKPLNHKKLSVCRKVCQIQILPQQKNNGLLQKKKKITITLKK